MKFTEEDTESLLDAIAGIIKGNIVYGKGFDTEEGVKECAEKIVFMIKLGLED